MDEEELKKLLSGEAVDYDEELVEGFKAFFQLMGDSPQTLTKLELEAYDAWEGTGMEYPPANLKGIERCTSLKTLVVDNIGIEDVAPIAALTTLTKLDLSNNPIEDLSPLASLTRLRELTLINMQYRSIAPLAKLTKLKKLFLSSTTTFTDLSPLAACTALEHLSLAGTHVTDLSPIAKLPKLAELNLRATEKLVVKKGNATYKLVRSLLDRGVDVWIQKPALTNTWGYTASGKKLKQVTAEPG